MSTLAVLAMTAIVAKALKAGFAFLRDIDWDHIDSKLRVALEKAAGEIDSQPSGLARLRRSEELLESSGEIERDEAAMLASATLELGLRSLAKRVRISVPPDEDSLVGLAIGLAASGHITHAEREMIKHHAIRVRNRVMHGDLGSITNTEVSNLIASTRAFFVRHNLS